jgi:hypothetical protein
MHVTSQTPLVRTGVSADLPVRLLSHGSPATGITPVDVAGSTVKLFFNNGEEVDVSLSGSNWIEETAPGNEGTYYVVVPATTLTRLRVGPFQWAVIPDVVAGAFDAGGFVGYGTLEDFQAVAGAPGDAVMAAATREGQPHTVGGALRLVHQHFGGRSKLDAGANTRTIYDEQNTTPLAVANALDNLGNPSHDPVYETVVPPDTTPPAVSSHTPTSGQTGVAHNVAIVVNLSKLVDPDTVSSTTAQLLISATPQECEVELVGQTLTIYPNQLLQLTTVYTVQLTTGIRDLSGNALPSTSWNFTTS